LDLVSEDWDPLASLVYPLKAPKQWDSISYGFKTLVNRVKSNDEKYLKIKRWWRKSRQDIVINKIVYSILYEYGKKE
jgi:siroheme synthase (precorrin-2 oxidase/ferrochelatase)